MIQGLALIKPIRRSVAPRTQQAENRFSNGEIDPAKTDFDRTVDGTRWHPRGDNSARVWYK
jgi:hypothetical protein